MSSPATAEQPAPQSNDQPAIWGLVVLDMMDRDRMGRAKYGTRLQPHNGRDALTDLYQEQLDAVAYSKQLMVEMQQLGKDLSVVQEVLRQLSLLVDDRMLSARDRHKNMHAAISRAMQILDMIFKQNPVLGVDSK